MATLNINVKGIEALARASQGFGGDALTRQLRTQGRLAERMARTFQSTLDSIDKRLGGIARQMDRQLTSVIPAGMERRFDQTTNNIQVNVTQLTKNVSNQFTSISNTFEKGMDKALDKVQRKGVQTARRLATAFSLAGRGLGRTGIGAGRFVGGAGGAIGSALSGIGTGGFGLGGIVRGVGGGAAGLLGGAGSLVGGGLSGIGGALSAGATGVGSLFGPIGTAIGGGIGGAASGITGAVSGALQGAAQVGSGVLSAATNLGGAIADRISGILKVGLVAGVAIAFTSVAKAADFERIEEPFRNIARSVGTDATQALEGFREATRGTVSDLDLMTQFNRAVQLGAVTSAKDFEKLSEASRRLGKAVGRNAKDALEDLSLGIGRQSRLILDNLGIVVSAEGAYQSYAASVGKTASALSETEKRTAFVTAAMKAVDTALAKAGPEVETFADTWDKLKATFENLLVAVGRPLIAVLKEVLPEVRRIAEGFASWLSDNRVQIADRLKESVSGLVEGLRSVADLVAGSSPSEFFSALRAATDNVTSYIAFAFEEVSLRIESALVSGAARAVEGIKAELKVGVGNILQSILDNPASGIGIQRRLFDAVFGGNSFDDAKKLSGVDSATLRAEAATSGSDRAAAATRGINDRIAALEAARNALPDLLSPLTDQLQRVRSGAPASPSGGPSPLALGAPGDPRQFIFRPPGLKPDDVISDTRGVTAGLDPSFFSPARIAAIKGAASTGAPIPASTGFATDAENLLRSGLESLATLGIDLQKLVPEVRDQVFKALESEETVGRLRERAADHLSRAYDRAVDAEISLAEQKLQDVEKQKAAQEKALEAFERGMEQLSRSYEETIEGIRRNLEETRAQIENARQQTLQDIERQVQGRVNALAGIGGGLDPQGGLPLNVFKAIAKVRRSREKQRFESLRSATSGLSSNDLAANDGFLLQQALREQAEREVGSAALIAEANAKAAEDLRAAAAEAAEAERAALETFAAAAAELRATLGEVSAETIKALSDVIASMNAIKAEQLAQKALLQRLRGSIR